MQINMHIKPQPTETLLPLDISTTTTPQHHPAQPPSPKPHLYFAYGSNLSPTQMTLRCTINPSHSAKPLAIASLPHWRWHINEAGYANVLPPAGLRISSQLSPAADKIPISGVEDTVYGVLYEMDPGDERILDGYEGIDTEADVVKPVPGRERGIDVDVRPREQGEGDYNKWYVDAVVVEWLDGGSQVEYERGKWKGGEKETVRILVYVDEERVVVSRPNAEYIPRMNRAMREAEELGVSGRWLGEVLRRFIPEE
ncbi:uncharacterized protein N7496_000339 [Penicillium cataractarum]|uniref:gamma-glutamylcyclotransferase n=1 Tax=Penicillium cataractarum TaxID=2100454 RepID=A0A9X0B5X7_9EURO|nr:uncharacterized protein N7496_000339 [Penicillium cataractarum]KAJ5389271.1 hypothetical protein N7496_000339 [Penicillium cataractarum]